MILGENVYIEKYCNIECVGGNITIGDNTYMNMRSNIISLDGITIGEMCILGPGIGIYDHNHKYINYNITIRKQGYETKRIVLGNNIWLGTNSIVTKGILISDNCVIGANSAVTKNIEKSGVYCGIPCKLVKSIY